MSENDIKKQIYELCDKEITKESLQKLKELILPYKNGLIGLAQLNPVAGNIEYNAKKIVEYIRHAQSIGLDLIVFPELILTGAPLGDALNRYPNIIEENYKWLEEIATSTKETAALVGFIDNSQQNSTNFKEYSAVAVLQNGKIKEIIRKTSTNNSRNHKITVINGKKYVIIIGNDFSDDENFDNEKPDILINCSSDPTNTNDAKIKFDVLSYFAKKYSIPTVYINQVGSIDNYSFNGSSSVIDINGKLFANTKYFEEQLLIVNPEKNLGKIYQTKTDFKKSAKFSLDYEYDLERTYKTLIQGIKDYFCKTGFKRAVLGLSGGLDSTVCAVLLTDALGAENVYGISMPSKITSQASKSDAEDLAMNLGINFATIPIKDMVDTTNSCLQPLFKTIEKNWIGRYEKSYTMDNIQARSRAVILWGISNEFENCLPIATSDKSEAYMGYATINGDMSGGFAPIADITKTKLFALARWLNKKRQCKNAIPESIILKKPGAELAIDPKTGKPLCAEDALMPYEFMDEVIWRIENKKETYNQMINSEFLYEQTHNISKEQKTFWLDKFYKRMSGALYKKSILPPFVNVDSFIQYENKQPITSSKINYKSTSPEQIKAILNQK